MDRKTTAIGIKKIHRTVNCTLKNVNLFPNHARILIACSGGPDSMVLVDILLALSVHRKADWHIGVATMNHGIRPEGIEELQMVSEYCRALQIPFYGTTMDIPSLAKDQHISLETAGRIGRYQWLIKIARQEKYAYIVTAHHKDDQCETIMAHLIRGAGIQGLVGMDVVNYTSDIPIVRPLLDVRKWELIEYAELSNIPYCIDMSNYDTSYTRNRIRHLVMPELESINPNVVDTVCRMGVTAKEDTHFIETSARLVYDTLVNEQLTVIEGSAYNTNSEIESSYAVHMNNENCINMPVRMVRRISRRALRKQPLALQRRIWQLLCTPLQLSWAHQQQLQDIVNTGEPKTLQIREVTIIAQCDTISVYLLAQKPL